MTRLGYDGESTIGNQYYSECPWCHKNLGPFETEDLEDGVIECKECGKEVTLSIDWDVTIRSTKH